MKTFLILLILLNGKCTFAQVTQTSYRSQSDSAACITRAKLLLYEPVDSLFQRVTKPAISNMIYSIKRCGFGYRYDTSFKDKTCRLLLPNWLDDYSLSFGDDDFFISFDDHDPASLACIVLRYDFKNIQHAFYREQENNGLRTNGVYRKKMHFRKNEKGLYNGEIFLDDQISIAFYTSEFEKVQQLKTCILSCRLD